MPLCDLNAKSKSGYAPISRSAMRRRLARQSSRTASLQANNEALQQQIEELQKRLKDTSQELELTKAELLSRQFSDTQLFSAPLLQRERPLPGHQYGPSLIAGSIELAKRCGFRAAADVLQLVFDMLKIDLKVPSHDAIEQWTLRFGVASFQDTFSKDDRVVWMADHSSQVGKERLLLIVGVALDDLPPPGQTLTCDKMEVLAIVPGRSWKKEDVEREYLKLAKQIGAPVYLLCDGASELRDPAKKLAKDGVKTIVLGDLKHHAANVLEKEVGRDERFKDFLSEVGLTRNRVQQTELDLFAPPKLKPKSRFMNLGSLFNWAMMVLSHLDHPDSVSRKGISDERMEEKLGWLRQYADDLQSWNQCQRVIDSALMVSNKMGLDQQTANLVEQSLNELHPNWRSENSSATRIGFQLIDWIQQSSNKLRAGERACLSTEIIESLFGRFKQMERQHSNGGFTRLIAALPTLCVRATRERVRAAFRCVTSETTTQWIKEKLKKTLTARRNAAYREARQKTRDHVFSAA